MTEGVSNKIQLGSWSFNEIKIDDIDLFSEYIKATEYPVNLWSSNFAYIWASGQSNRKKILWKIVDDMLVTFIYSSLNSLYLMCLPFGKCDPDKLADVLLKCLEYCCEWNENDKSRAIVRTINSMQLDFLKKSQVFNEKFKLIPLVGLEKHFSIPKVVLLQGKDFRNVKKKVNRFKNLYPDAVIRRYTPDDYDEVIKLSEHWSSTAGKKYTTIFDKVYFTEIVRHYDELAHLIMIVEVDGKIVGMISGGELPTGQSWGCLSKFMNEYDGLSESMIVEISREILKTNPAAEYLNTGSDLGPGGLRFFKDKFRPALNLKRYRIKLR